MHLERCLAVYADRSHRVPSRSQLTLVSHVPVRQSLLLLLVFLYAFRVKLGITTVVSRLFEETSLKENVHNIVEEAGGGATASITNIKNNVAFSPAVSIPPFTLHIYDRFCGRHLSDNLPCGYA